MAKSNRITKPAAEYRQTIPSDGVVYLNDLTPAQAKRLKTMTTAELTALAQQQEGPRKGGPVMKKHRTTAGKPAVTLPGIATEQDREIVRRRDAGETRATIAQALGVSVSLVMRAEWRERAEKTAQHYFE
jgi:hypothetical protein